MRLGADRAPLPEICRAFPADGLSVLPHDYVYRWWLGLSVTSIGIYTLLGLAAISFARLGKLGRLSGPLADLSQVAGIAGWILISLLPCWSFLALNFNLTAVDT